MYFDSHAHYDDKHFDHDRSKLLSKLPDLGVLGVINLGACLDSSKASVALAEKYPYIYAAAGVHPHDASKMTEATLEEIKMLCTNKKVVAVGEIGLDFHYENSPRDAQRKWFIKQLELARSIKKPVAIHSREAAEETFKIIKESGVDSGVIHCYSGKLPMALEYIERGFYIGLGGPVTYKNAKRTREVAAGIPLDRLLIETDAPYLSPELCFCDERLKAHVPTITCANGHKKRDKRNDSSKLVFVAEAIAAARGISPQEVAKTTAQNAKKLFGIQ